MLSILAKKRMSMTESEFHNRYEIPRKSMYFLDELIERISDYEAFSSFKVTDSDTVKFLDMSITAYPVIDKYPYPQNYTSFRLFKKRLCYGMIDIYDNDTYETRRKRYRYLEVKAMDLISG